MNFNAAALFVKVVRSGSFSETARRTNVPIGGKTSEDTIGESNHTVIKQITSSQK